MKKEKEQVKIIVYMQHMNCIGGIETFIYNWIKRLNKYYNIQFLFRSGYMEQIRRMDKLVDAIPLIDSEEYECDILLMACSANSIPNNIKFKRCIQMVHANYKYLKEKLHLSLKTPKEADNVVCVSNIVKEMLNEMNNEDGDVIYNILDEKQKVNKVLHLVSACRLSSEKGYDRMCTLAHMLKDNGYKFDWKIFTDLSLYPVKKLDMEEVHYYNITLDIFDYLADADYGVQLSDTEACPYFVNECLQYGTPLLITNYEGVRELVTENENAYILNLEMDNVDLEKIVNNIPNKFVFEEKCTVKQWLDYIGDGVEINKDKINTKEANNKFDELVKLKAIISYTDNELKRNIKRNEIIEVDRLRAYELTSHYNASGMKLCQYV